MPPGMQMTALTLMKEVLDPKPSGPWHLDINTKLATINDCNVSCPLHDILR
jgi:hypothetical protein